MSKKIGFSSYSVNNYNFDKMISFCEKYNFNALEFWLDDLDGSNYQIKTLSKLSKDEIKISIHSPILNIGNESEFSKNKDCLQNVIEKAYLYSAKTVVLHFGEANNQIDTSKNHPINITINLLNSILESLAMRNITLSLENVGYQENDLVKGFKLHKEIIDAINSNYIKATLDIAHANITSSPEEGVYILGDMVQHLHISDNHGYLENHHQPLGLGNIDFKFIKHIISSLGIVAIIEIHPDDNWQQNIIHSRSILL